MKKFEKPVRWEFKLAMHGYGKNVGLALKDALRLMEYELENHSVDLEAIEKHEVVNILEDDIDEEERE